MSYEWRTRMQMDDEEIEAIYQQFRASGGEHGEIPKREIRWGKVLGMAGLAVSGFAVAYSLGKAAQWLWKLL